MEGMTDLGPSQMRLVVQCSSHWPSVFPTAAVSHSPLVCRRAVLPSAHRSWPAVTPEFHPAIPLRHPAMLRSVRSSHRRCRARPCWLAPVPTLPPAHRADRSDRITHRIGTSVPAWPFDSASVSATRVSRVVLLHSFPELRSTPVLP